MGQSYNYGMELVRERMMAIGGSDSISSPSAIDFSCRNREYVSFITKALAANSDLPDEIVDISLSDLMDTIDDLITKRNGIVFKGVRCDKDAAPPLGVPVVLDGHEVVYTGTDKEFEITPSHVDFYNPYLADHVGAKGCYYYYRQATQEERIRAQRGPNPTDTLNRFYGLEELLDPTTYQDDPALFREAQRLLEEWEEIEYFPGYLMVCLSDERRYNVAAFVFQKINSALAHKICEPMQYCGAGYFFVYNAPHDRQMVVDVNGPRANYIISALGEPDVENPKTGMCTWNIVQKMTQIHFGHREDASEVEAAARRVKRFNELLKYPFRISDQKCSEIFCLDARNEKCSQGPAANPSL